MLLESVRSCIAENNASRMRDLAETAHPADMVEVIEDLSDEEVSALFGLIPDDKAADIIQELEPTRQSEVIHLIGAQRASLILREMDSDDAADLIRELPEAKAEKLLDMMNSEGDDVRELLQYEEDTSGSIMATEYVTVHATWTVEQTLAELRRVAPEAETVYYTYVIDNDSRLVGVLSLRDLVIADLKAVINEIMNPNVVTVPVDADQEEAAQLFKKYRFLALPVVDDKNRLTGIITADDILDVVEEEATEDIQKIAGTMPLDRPYFATSFKELWSSRIVWLLVLFLAESITGSIMEKFTEAMQNFIALTFFIPLLIDCGGNAGSQSASVVIRGLAVRDIRIKDFWSVFWRELLLGLSLGLAMSGVAFIRAWRVGGTPYLGITVCIAVLAIVAMATVVGAVLPIIATVLKLDPAVVSAPLITTIVDAFGLIIYFRVAKTVLHL